MSEISDYINQTGPAVVAAVMAADDGASNNAITIDYSGSATERLVVFNGGVLQCAIAGGTITANTRSKIAASYALDDFASSVNGGSVGTDISGTIPTVTQLRIGNDGVNWLNGHIQNLSYYKPKLVNTQLPGLST